MEDTKNKKLSAKLLAIAIAAALALSAAPVLAEDKTPVDLEGTITGWQEGNGGPGSLEAGSANADGKMSIAIGDESSKDAGNGATASGENSIAIGGASSKASGALATGQDAIAIGAGTVASNARATSIGALAEASGISASLSAIAPEHSPPTQLRSAEAQAQVRKTPWQ